MAIHSNAGLACLLLSTLFAAAHATGFDYKDALKKSIIFLEAQRSGKLPSTNRVPWRGDSALTDGHLANVDLVGGYYDAGDNVKYGLPLAFTVTTLAWSAATYSSELQAAGELEHVHEGIRWGTDYLLKASAKPNILFVQVGDPVADHECWIRPENMKTNNRTVLKIDPKTPGTELAAETSAALAASSVVFKKVDASYSRILANRAESLFQFAKKYKGTYDGECPFYCSNSGSNDEMLWAATWLHKATGKAEFMDYIHSGVGTSAAVSEFSWDLKYAGAQVLLSQYFFEGQKDLHTYKEQADSFMCSILPDSPHHQIKMSPAGLIHMRDGANSQYVTSAAFLFSVYSDLLGANPKGTSIMVGFGKNSPTHAHHRGASVPKMSIDKVVNCGMSFVYWYNTKKPNPNELTGAILGGPDDKDNFVDDRTMSSYTEPTTYTNSVAVGVLAKLAGSSRSQS